MFKRTPGGYDGVGTGPNKSFFQSDSAHIGPLIEQGGDYEKGNKAAAPSGGGTSAVVIILQFIILAFAGACFGFAIASFVKLGPIGEDCKSCTELLDFFETGPESCYPRPECTAYDPQTPPPGWPEFAAPWALRGNISAALRCNLTPPLVNINATVAMNSYERQNLDNGTKVIFIDVRTPEEVYWVGTPTQVNKITLNTQQEIIPDYFLATLEPDCVDDEDRIHFTVDDFDVWIPVSQIASTSLSAVSYNVPVEYVDSTTGEKTLNRLWGKQADAIIRETGADRIIFFCRSGQRSSIGCYYEFCPFEQLFPGILGAQMIAYEVESAITNGRGGFQGTDYDNKFLGYRGYPERSTDGLEVSPSAAFMDAGLPMDTGLLPKTVRVQPLTGETLHLDTLDAPSWAESP